MTSSPLGIDWKRALVYGLGVSGLAATRLLRDHEVEVIGVDRRGADSLDLGGLEHDSGIELYLGLEPEDLPRGVDGIVVSPGVPADRPLLLAAKNQGVPVVAEVELGYLYARGPIVGITGSNGKSTTTALTGDLLVGAGVPAVVCGNIGVPLSAVVGRRDHPVFVTELSSFQLETIDSFRPRAAALLNLSDDHLDRHRDAVAYIAAKVSLFRNQMPEDIAVLNADDSRVAGVEVSARPRWFSRQDIVEDGCFVDGDQVVEVSPGRGRRVLFRRQDMTVKGLHNVENAMAAALLSMALGADPRSFASTLSRFRGLPHRLEQVRNHRDVIWFDDSKATNFAATLKSLEGFEDGSVHLILGGRGKGGDPSVLSGMIDRKVKRLYLIGESAAEMRANFGSLVETEMVGDLARAVGAAASRARGGEVVLLSPACASFDQYRDFNERGDHFQQLARSLDG